MKCSLFSLFALAAVAAATATQSTTLKDVIVSYPDDTPPYVIDQAMKEIVDYGGSITHVYKLFKGFAAHAAPPALGAISTANQQYKAEIEEDQIVHTN